ncbi:carbohydrate-binding domain-containing protein [Mycolicibacterium hodleri]|uniref:carbohydrate-binding domain-containing protein n=1 Tax=Mycolicibacterium hodleri TaxID=49897 RepID=UPI0021F2B871|nr:carbohydrate-binding domain-containing protein [Mycolicibacterium hodleri]
MNSSSSTARAVSHRDAGTTGNQRPAPTNQRPATTARSNSAATQASKTQTPSGESTGVTSTSVDARTTPKVSAVTSAVAVETASSVVPTTTATATATSAAPAGQVPATPDGTSLSLTLLAATRREPDSVTGNATTPTAAKAATQVAAAQVVAATSAAVVPKTATSATTTAATSATTTAATSATTTAVTNPVIEAEAMTLTPSGAGGAYQESSASGQGALLLASNSTASTTLSLPASTNIVIRARGDQFFGAPSMTVSVDGKVVSTAQVSSTTWLDYNVPVTIAAGVHTVSVAFTNDLYLWPGLDRNLRVDKITVVAKQTTTPTTPTTPTSPTTSSPSFFNGADWLWKPISANAATAANSATWVSYLSAPSASRIADLYDYGVTVIPASAITSSTPRYDVKLTQPWGSDPFGTYTVPIPLGTKVPPGSDGQITVQDPVTGKVFGIWQAKYDSATNTWSGSWGGMTDLKGNGVDASGSATASNISRYAGVITAAEFSAAVAANTGVNHALVFATDIAGPAFVGPAIKSDGANLAGVAVPIPEGYRIQLDPSINVDAIPGITAGEKVIAKTLQTYGAYVVDQGSARMAFAFETVPGATAANPGAAWTNAGLSWDYYDMAKIPWSKLRVLAPAAG